jgi:hypothetical protein
MRLVPRCYKRDKLVDGESCKQQTHPLVRENLTEVFSWKIKLLIVSLKGLVAKKKLIGVNLQS